MHELAHIALHFDQDIFYDEIENTKEVNIDTREQEADALAGEALLPSAKWEAVSYTHLLQMLVEKMGVDQANYFFWQSNAFRDITGGPDMEKILLEILRKIAKGQS